MPVRMDAQEGYRPLPAAVKARATARAVPVTCQIGPTPPTGGLRAIRSGACDPRPTTLRTSETRGNGQDRGLAPRTATVAQPAAVPTSHRVARPRSLIAPGHPGTGRAWPTPPPAKGRCAATPPRPDSRHRFTRPVSLPAGTSVVTAYPALRAPGLTRRARQDRPT